jgi:putative oxidoreductase
MPQQPPQRSGFLVLARGIANMAQPFAALATRLVIGWAFLIEGIEKCRHYATLAQYFASIHIPQSYVIAALVAGVELIGGACLIVGLGTRIAAVVLASVRIAAIMAVYRSEVIEAIASADVSILEVTPVLFVMFLLWLVTFGPGAFSIDRMFFGKYDARPRT